MSRGGSIALRPERCDHCGRCVPACSRRLVKVTGSHLYVDSNGCDGCMKCVAACGRGAIVKASSATGRTVVGSRAEAKALKKAAQKSAKVAAKPTPAAATAAAGAAASASASASAGASASASANAPVIGSRAGIGGTGAPSRVATAAREAVANQSAAWRSAAAGSREMPGAAPWTWVDAVIIVAVLFAAYVASEATLSSSAVALMPEAGRIAARALVLGLFATVEFIALTALARRHGMSLRQAFGSVGATRSGQDRIADGILVIGLLIGLRLISLLWGALARAVHLEVPAGDKLVEVFGAGPLGLALSALIVVLVTPVAEELIFRGVVQKGLAQRFGPWTAIAGAAAVFALLHFTPWMFVPVFALGVAAGWLAWNRGSLWPAVALHVLYNGTAVGAAFWLAR